MIKTAIRLGELYFLVYENTYNSRNFNIIEEGMKKVFTEKVIREIAGTLKCDWKYKGNNYRLTLVDSAETRKLALEIYPDIKIGNKVGTVISVLTENTHLQLHFCTGYVVSEMLREVTFYSEENEKVCGITVEHDAGCSMYSNLDRSVLSGDFSNLGPEVMLSGIALSLTEHILNPSD